MHQSYITGYDCYINIIGQLYNKNIIYNITMVWNSAHCLNVREEDLELSQNIDDGNISAQGEVADFGQKSNYQRGEVNIEFNGEEI